MTTDRREIEHLVSIVRKTGKLVSTGKDSEGRVYVVLVNEQSFSPLGFVEWVRGILAKLETEAKGPYERHMLVTPGATISEAEYNWLQHIGRYGSTAYPVRKTGRKWAFERMHGTGGSPKLYDTKREAFAVVESYYNALLDKNAGREVGTTELRIAQEATARARGDAVS